MSLRLLPAITLDNDDDDDGNFTKWMSSYWGHEAQGSHSKDRKRSFRRPARSQTDRRGSLPTMSQLDTMSLNRLHAAAIAPGLSHVRTRDELEVRPHPRATRSSSDNCRPKSTVPEARISTIPEVTLEQRLRSITLNEENRLCLICHEVMQKNGEGTKELHCTHRFHKEAQRRSERCSEAGHKHTDQRRRSADAHLHNQDPQQEAPLHRQLSLRKHR
ncbi:unnamed protein product [Knipowitschia caucasica]|uniref:Leukemia NUP98 fusion partner 1 n=1 Tax=Knipowitschia caucasica TaxID=637954 RepID=A0AAV2KTW5_KNICA